MTNKLKIYLLLILLLAAFLRLYQLDRVPPSPSLDEVSIGWNAYSISQTGMDEYGNRLPILLRAYDDWRPALYVYLVAPFVKFTGLNVLSVRLPSVILSIMTVLAVYFLIKELFNKSAFRHQLSVISTFLLAISPWHIYLSRLGHEVNAGVAFIAFAVLFFLKWVNSKKVLFVILSSLFFALSLYTYQSEKIFAPTIVLILAILFKKNLLASKKQAVLALIVGLIFVLPILRVSLNSQALIRLKGTSAFSSANLLYEFSSERMIYDREKKNALGLAFDNQNFANAQIFLINYFSHFDPRWLFTNGGADSHKVPGMGLFYIWEVPFILYGIYILLSKNFPKNTKWLIFLWLLLAPIPASITTDAPHAMRIFNAVPVFPILTALGVYQFFIQVKKNKFNIIRVVFFLSLVILNFLYFYHNYFFNFPREQARSFQYALSQAIPYVESVQGNYDKIVFSNKDDLYQSYMFFLFFTRYDPKLYLQQGGTGSGGYIETHRFGKFEFRPLDWGNEKRNTRTLFLGTPRDLPFSNVKTFYYLNGQEGIRIIGG